MHASLKAEGQVIVNVGKLYQWPKGARSEFDEPRAYIPSGSDYPPTPPNSGLHPTRDTHALMFLESPGRAGDAGRWAASYFAAVIGLPRGNDDDFHS